MARSKEKSVVALKLIYTLGIVIVYLIGRNVPLYGVDYAAYQDIVIDTQTIFSQAINGDLSRYSIFSLGFSAYICASMLGQLFRSGRRGNGKSKTSAKRSNQKILFLTLVIGVVQSILRSMELIYKVRNEDLLVTLVVVIVEMIAGMFLLLWLSDRNQKYGIGGRSALIFINVIDGLLATLRTIEDYQELVVPLIISGIVLIIVLIMENTEKRMPLQRISIHNVHADKNYLAIKLNPVGIMPIMFATAAFMIPRFFVSMLASIFQDNAVVFWLNDNMSLTRPLGIGVYVFILFFLTISFAMIMISPGELTEKFLKSGDSLRDIRAGKMTKRYLTFSVLAISILSSLVMSICVGLPMVLQIRGGMSQTLSVIPSSLMILTGIWSSLYQEFVALRKYDSYKSFI